VLQEALNSAQYWSKKVDTIQSDDNYPYLDVLETLVARGRPIPIRLEQFPQMESQIAAARAWKDRAARTFVKKGCSQPLIELITPRKDIGKASSLAKGKKKKGFDCKENKDIKDTDVEADLINLDNYVAVDRITRLQQLKEEKRIEEELIIAARKENLRRVREEVVQGPYCVCRKGIDGFMIRCSLCYDWFHGTCVTLPKTVNGKPLSKTQNSFDTMRGLKFMCPLCARTRRPRLETILSLLVSLQKLPVRLPEGEALQFLIERVMQWQEKVKTILKDARVQKLLQQLKTKTETTNGNTISSTQITFKRLENDHTQHIERGIFEKDLLTSEKIAMEDSVQEVEEVNPLPIIKPREKIISEGVKSQPVDDHLTLECEEEMTESPKSMGSRDEFKDGVIDLEDPKKSTLLKQSRPQTPVDVCELSDDVSLNMKNCLKRSKGELEDSVLDDIENLLREGDLLEVTMDETQQLWMLLQSERPLLPDHCNIMDSEYRKLLQKNAKLRKKRKMDKEKHTNGIPASSVSATSGKDEAKVMPAQKKPKHSGSLTSDVDVDVMETEDYDDSDEDCAAKPCKQPTGDEVGWVQCDPCSNWYHVICIGITAEAADAMETYACPTCVKSGSGPIPETNSRIQAVS